MTLKTFNDFSRHWVSAPCLKPPAGGQCLVDVWWLASFVVENVVAESTWPSKFHQACTLRHMGCSRYDFGHDSSFQW